MTPTLLPAQGRQRDGPSQSNPPPRSAPRPLLRGGRLTGRPSPPPPRQADPAAAGRTGRPGLPHDPGGTRTPGGDAPATKRGLGREPQAAPPGRGRWGTTSRPPPLSPHSPPPTQGPRWRRPPNPPKAEVTVPPPPGRTAASGRGAAAGPASTPPAACSRRNCDGQANPRQHTRASHGPRPGTASEQEPERYGGHALHGQSDAEDTRFVACPGKAEGRTEARRPPAPLPPPAAPSGGTACRPTPPPQAQPPALEHPRRADPPHGERTAPSQEGGNRDRAAPPPSRPNGAWDRGRTRGGARTMWNGPTSAQNRDRARCVRHTNQGRGGGGDAARARVPTHTKDTRGVPEGQPDRARGMHRPHGMAYQRARIRHTRTGRPATHSAGNAGRQGGNEEDTTPGTGPSPPNRPRAPRTDDQGTAPAKAVVAYRARHQPHG